MNNKLKEIVENVLSNTDLTSQTNKSILCVNQEKRKRRLNLKDNKTFDVGPKYD
jgi:hypothetical protein